MARTDFERRALAMGGRLERRLPSGVYRGRFLFTGVITDDATTAVDLTASAAAFDRKILDCAGLSAAADNPAVVLRVERMAFGFAEGQESPAVLASLLKQIEMTHSPAGGGAATRILQMHEYHSPLFASVAPAADAGVATVFARRPRTHFVPYSPLVINMQYDTWTIQPRAKVNTADGDVTFLLWIDGIVHSNAGWSRTPAECEDAADGEIARAQLSDELFDYDAPRIRVPKISLKQNKL